MEVDLGPLPVGWRWERVGRLCECVSVGYVSSTRAFFCPPGEGVPLVRSQNIRPGRLVLDDIAWVTRTFHDANPKSQLRPGDVLVTRVGANAGDVCIVPDGLGQLHLSSAVFARPLAEHRKYIELFFRSPLGQYLLKTRIVGSVSERINTRDVAALSVLLPSPKEEAAIGHILGTLDEKIELNRRMNETLEAMARALFKSWFVDFDPVRAKAAGRDPALPPPLADRFPARLVDSEFGEIPEGWEVKKLSELCSTQYGYTASAVSEPIGPKFVRVTDINKLNWIQWADVPHCTIDTEVMADYALRPGDIVVARMADPGKSAIIEEPIDAVFASYLVRLTTKSLADSYFVYGFLKSDRYLEYVEGAKSGSVQANMNARVIVGADLVLPPQALVDRFLEAVLPLRRRLASSVRESQALAALRDALLPKLISGELRLKGLKPIMSAYDAWKVVVP